MSAPDIPDWSRELFTEFLDHQRALNDVLRLSTMGISMIRGVPNVLKALANVPDKKPNENEPQRLARAEHDSKLAEREVEQGYPLLYEQATVALWSSLEAVIRTFVARWLEATPAAWDAESIRKLKVRLGDYMALEPFDRCLWVVDLIDQESGGPLRVGVNRFESLLQPIGLAGDVKESTKKLLFELSNVRHLIVHRRAFVDRRLLLACPWLQVRVGDRLRVTRDMWLGYNKAVAEYALEIIQRLRVVSGVGRYVPSENPNQLKASTLPSNNALEADRES